MRLFPLLLAACTATVADTDDAPPVPTADSATTTSKPTDTGPEKPLCSHPAAPEDMAEGEILKPYGWKVAYHRDGRQLPLFMERAYCNDQKEIDWSPFDVLVFVAIPAW